MARLYQVAGVLFALIILLQLQQQLPPITWRTGPLRVLPSDVAGNEPLGIDTEIQRLGFENKEVEDESENSDRDHNHSKNISQRGENPSKANSLDEFHATKEKEPDPIAGKEDRVAFLDGANSIPNDGSDELPYNISQAISSLERSDLYRSSPKETKLHRFVNSGERGGLLCHAVCVVGIPRTLINKPVYAGLRDNFVASLKPCVDVYWAIETEGTGHRPGIPELPTTYADLIPALQATKPVFIQNAPGGWRQKFRKCVAAAKIVEASIVPSASSSSLSPSSSRRHFYDIIHRVRPDFLFYKQIDAGAIYPSPAGGGRPRHYFSNIFDFYEAFSQPKLPGTAVVSHSVDFPGARICRPDPRSQRILDAFDLMWQNLLPLSKDAPRWVNMVPSSIRPARQFGRSGQAKEDIAFRTFSVFCYRFELLELELDGEEHEQCETCREDACGGPPREWSFHNHHLHVKGQKEPEQRCALAQELLWALRQSNDGGDSGKHAAEIITYLYHTAEFLVENFSRLHRQFWHIHETCRHFRTELADSSIAPNNDTHKDETGSGQDNEGGDAKGNDGSQVQRHFSMLNYYDHSSIECDSSVTPATARLARQSFVRESIQRLVHVLDESRETLAAVAAAAGESTTARKIKRDADGEVGQQNLVVARNGSSNRSYIGSGESIGNSSDRGSEDRSGSLSKSGYSLGTSKQRNGREAQRAGAIWARTHAELAIFCDIYRYQLDFLSSGTSGGVSRSERHEGISDADFNNDDEDADDGHNGGGGGVAIRSNRGGNDDDHDGDEYTLVDVANRFKVLDAAMSEGLLSNRSAEADKNYVRHSIVNKNSKALANDPILSGASMSSMRKIIEQLTQKVSSSVTSKKIGTNNDRDIKNTEEHDIYKTLCDEIVLFDGFRCRTAND